MRRKNRQIPKEIDAGKMIAFIGAEVSWEILKAEDRWYVVAQHHGETPEDTFRVERVNYRLDLAVTYVGRYLWRHGPKWIRTFDAHHR